MGVAPIWNSPRRLNFTWTQLCEHHPDRGRPGPRTIALDSDFPSRSLVSGPRKDIAMLVFQT